MTPTEQALSDLDSELAAVEVMLDEALALTGSDKNRKGVTAHIRLRAAKKAWMAADRSGCSRDDAAALDARLGSLADRMLIEIFGMDPSEVSGSASPPPRS